MSEQIKDGGPAFPALKSLSNRTPAYAEATTEGGMTLRDYFAAKAMSIAAEHMLKKEPSTVGDFTKAVAICSYLIADAMITAREQA